MNPLEMALKLFIAGKDLPFTEGIMKIAVISIGNGFDDQVDPRFGRCAYFLIVNTETMNVEPIENSSVALGGGAGIQSAQRVSAG